MNTTDRSELYEAMRHLLADTYCLLIKTHNFHWNVTGPHFGSLHNLFEEQYNELFLAADEIAERLRALGARAPGSPQDFQDLSQIAPGTGGEPALTMVEELATANNQTAATANTVRAAAEAINDDATADLAIARIQVHDKAAWMLRSFLE